MRIGLIAPPWIPVPPPAYGGTEEVIDNLARGLTALGHDVRLFTVGESTCPVPRQCLFASPAEPMGAHHFRISQASLRAAGADVYDTDGLLIMAGTRTVDTPHPEADRLVATARGDPD